MNRRGAGQQANNLQPLPYSLALSHRTCFGQLWHSQSGKGVSSGRFEGTEQLGKGRNREKLRVVVAHLVNEQEARGTKMGRGVGGEGCRREH